MKEWLRIHKKIVLPVSMIAIVLVVLSAIYQANGKSSKNLSGDTRSSPTSVEVVASAANPIQQTATQTATNAATTKEDKSPTQVIKANQSPMHYSLRPLPTAVQKPTLPPVPSAPNRISQ